MGRTYAGVLGPLSFGTVVARNLVDGGDVESALLAASLALFTFAAIGYIIGRIAERTVVEAIETRFRAAWQAEDSANRLAVLTETVPIKDDATA